jgi:hypothetical protein
MPSDLFFECDNFCPIPISLYPPQPECQAPNNSGVVRTFPMHVSPRQRVGCDRRARRPSFRCAPVSRPRISKETERDTTCHIRENEPECGFEMFRCNIHRHKPLQWKMPRGNSGSFRRNACFSRLLPLAWGRVAGSNNHHSEPPQSKSACFARPNSTNAIPASQYRNAIRDVGVVGRARDRDSLRKH